MDSIRDKTSQIRNAVYGKDVRESIASGIEQISDREDLFEQTINASETIRQNNETLRKSNETTRGNNETLRQSNESTRVDNESLRQSNESTRVDNESLRQSNETTRVDNESLRQSNEATRVDNESLRQSNETTRQNEENTREANEDIRISEENSRKTSESTRVDNESLRQSNETTRVDNETLRQSNETTRVNQENTRKDNETTRQNQENTRKDNETARQNSINALKVNEPYDHNHDYVPLNKVTYQGSSYLNIIPCRGILPTNIDNWLCIASKGLDGIGAGDMTKMIYDKDDDGVVDRAEVADSVEWSNVKTKPDLTVYAEKTYVDEQIQTITETGIPKLVSYEYDLYATVEGQKVFEIPYDYYSHVTDTLIVEASGIDGPKTFYTITDPVTNPDNSITKGFITLTEGRPNGSFLKMRILKNVPLGPDGAISGAVMAIDSIPQNRVQGLVDLNNNFVSHEADNTKQIPHLGTTTNSGDAYSITTTETINTNQKFTIKFNAASTSAPTLKINTGSACAIKKANGNNAKLYASVYTLFWDGSVFTLLGEGGEYGTATVDKVLTGYSIGTENGLALGTMPNNGAINVTQTASGQVTTIPAGYTSGGQVTNNITVASLGGVLRIASSVTSASNIYYTVNLSFIPSLVLIEYKSGTDSILQIAINKNKIFTDSVMPVYVTQNSQPWAEFQFSAKQGATVSSGSELNFYSGYLTFLAHANIKMTYYIFE